MASSRLIRAASSCSTSASASSCRRQRSATDIERLRSSRSRSMPAFRASSNTCCCCALVIAPDYRPQPMPRQSGIAKHPWRRSREQRSRSPGKLVAPRRHLASRSGASDPRRAGSAPIVFTLSGEPHRQSLAACSLYFPEETLHLMQLHLLPLIGFGELGLCDITEAHRSNQKRLNIPDHRLRFTNLH